MPIDSHTTSSPARRAAARAEALSFRQDQFDLAVGIQPVFFVKLDGDLAIYAMPAKTVEFGVVDFSPVVEIAKIPVALHSDADKWGANGRLATSCSRGLIRRGGSTDYKERQNSRLANCFGGGS